MQDGVSPSPNPEGWSENLIEDWLTLVNRDVLGPLHQSKAATAHAYRHRDFLPLPANSGLCEFSSGCFLGALGLNALHGSEYEGLSGPTAAQLTVLAGLHDRVGFTFIMLREIPDPLTGKAACDKLFDSLTSVSAGAMVLDHNACDLIKPSATVNVVPHLDPVARVIVESPDGPVVQTHEGLRRFPPKLVSTTALLICSW